MSDLLYGTGWLPQLPDCRDYNILHPEVKPLLAQTVFGAGDGSGADPTTPPNTVDLRQWCSPIENQGSTNSCTAHAAVSLVEYMERKATGRHIDASRLFVYKVTRNLLGWTGDRGAYLRTAMQALALCGAPPEKYWAWNPANIDVEPSQFVYSLAGNFKSLTYFRADSPTGTRQQTLDLVKKTLASQLPVMFGFTCYTSLSQAQTTGLIPFPGAGDTVTGGHAVTAVGYDDFIGIGQYRGALLIRNSWGAGWGKAGYGYLPYQYVLSGLATDFWAVQSQAWVDTGKFS